MNFSAEIRWFNKGEIGKEITSYFRNNSIIFLNEKSRTDWYLSVSDKTTSVKLREGKFEVKRLSKVLDNFQVIPGVVGCIEVWTKYGFVIAPEDEEADKITEGKYPFWIPVEKKRSVAKYIINNNGNICQVSGEMHPVEGCTLEICSLITHQQTWWTLCLESSGSEMSVQNNLEMGLRHIFHPSDQLSLKVNQSYGYPQFLMML